ncbi:hypothetical protein EYR41_010943 [Orbilia oligospora]|uniref:Uncharacterized protein n=1 Tax=Orbilia oligospora TaxID=2813651 RepID=A0A7C8PN73_ORBOL|nr:hypothetical protein TWF751_008774 [Orbilia oligospora]TGJ62993.1 hypothetical protein EYR41_010943 [Orbilia oligospora]
MTKRYEAGLVSAGGPQSGSNSIVSAIDSFHLKEARREDRSSVIRHGFFLNVSEGFAFRRRLRGGGNPKMWILVFSKHFGKVTSKIYNGITHGLFQLSSKRRPSFLVLQKICGLKIWLFHSFGGLMRSNAANYIYGMTSH